MSIEYFKELAARVQARTDDRDDKAVCLSLSEAGYPVVRPLKKQSVLESVITSKDNLLQIRKQRDLFMGGSSYLGVTVGDFQHNKAPQVGYRRMYLTYKDVDYYEGRDDEIPSSPDKEWVCVNFSGSYSGICTDRHYKFDVRIARGMLHINRRQDEPIGRIYNVFVEPEFRHIGIASVVMLTLERIALVQGIEVLRLNTVRKTKKLYKSLGYTQTKRDCDKVWMNKMIG